jgi:hypothetical protein
MDTKKSVLFLETYWEKIILNSDRFQNLDAIVMVPLHPEKMKKERLQSIDLFC